VTGSSSGIGEATARRLLRDAWDVVGYDRAPATLDASNFHAVRVDLADAPALSKAVAVERNIKALVHAAGFMRVAPLDELDTHQGEDMWRLHVRAADALAPRLPAEGRIVLIGSRTAAGAAGRSQYAATEAALVGMARSWAIELAPRGCHRECSRACCNGHANAARQRAGCGVAAGHHRSAVSCGPMKWPR